MAPKYWNLPKRVIVEVIGGDADGLYLDSEDQDSALAEEAKSVYRMTEGGTVGRATAGLSMGRLIRLRSGDRSAAENHGGHAHYYCVSERIEEDSEILIRLQHSLTHPHKPKAQ